tara:strand:+ start:42 stop:413 length:372 start_codon:yes stop_codon:yes gene_type:complete
LKIKITPTDRLFSEYIRKKSGGVCSACGEYRGWENLQATHFISRRYKYIRWDEDNVSAQCASCHFKFHDNPHKHHQWKVKQLGVDRYNRLIDKSAVLAVGENKVTNDKLKDLRADLREKLKKL